MRKCFIALLSGAALSFFACGGSHGGDGGDPYLSSVIEKTNAKFAQLNEKAGVEQPRLNLSLEGNRLVYSVQVNKDEIPEDELKQELTMAEKFPGWIILAWKQIANEGEKTEVMNDDFFAKLKEKNLSIICQYKNKSGKVLGEVPLTFDLQTLEKTEMTQKKNREESEAINNRWEEERKIREAEIVPGTFTDPRDNHTYRTGTIIDKTWIADDLTYGSEAVFLCDTVKQEDSRCEYDDYFYEPPAGKLYTWEESKKVCPDGWRLPTIEELNSDYFKKFAYENNYMPEFSKKYNTVAYWSSSTKNEFGVEDVEAFQCKPVKDEASGGYHMTVKTIYVPMDKANSSEEKKFVRCIMD